MFNFKQPEHPFGWQDICVEDIPASTIRFHRDYTTRLLNNIILTVAARQSSFGVYYTANLSQPNGKVVSFDPWEIIPWEIVKDVLDVELRVSVKMACDTIIKKDVEWRKSKPNNFKDIDGNLWMRAI